MRYALITNNIVETLHDLNSKMIRNIKYEGQTYINPEPLHYLAAGWREEVVPVIDNVTQRLGDIVLTGPTTFTYEVIDKTPEEIELEDNTDKAQALSQEMYYVLKWLKAEGVISLTNINNAPQALKDAYLARQALEG